MLQKQLLFVIAILLMSLIMYQVCQPIDNLLLHKILIFGNLWMYLDIHHYLKTKT